MISVKMFPDCDNVHYLMTTIAQGCAFAQIPKMGNC